MTTSINALNVRRVLSRDEWHPPHPHGPDGWKFLHRDGISSVIVSAAVDPNTGINWVHASRTAADRVPTYEEMVQLHTAVWGSAGYSYEVHAPKNHHINIHPFALHLWGRADGRPVLPEFGQFGTI